MEVVPLVRIAATIACVVLAAACSDTESSVALEAKVAELTTQVKGLEAENERLRKQIQLLTKTADELTEVSEAQRSLGTIPVLSPTVTASPAATPR